MSPGTSWYRSFYWRIAIAFAIFAMAVVFAQGLLFRYLLERSNARSPALSPNNLATTVAADLGSAISEEPELDLGRYLTVRYGREPWRVFVVMKDGRSAGNTGEALPAEIRRSVDAALTGVDARTGDAPRITGPVVTAPIQIAATLRGMVVLPPPPPGGFARDVGRLLSLPGTLLLAAATAIVAVVIFLPARRRLRALEAAAARFGGGDLTVRAPEEGGDEIAGVARAFNRMAAELAGRDEALRASDRLRRQMLADVSHELKTPLTSMRGYLETLRMSDLGDDPERRERYVATVERETRRLEKIVADLLDLARYEGGAGSIEPRHFAIERVFSHVAMRHDREARDRSVTIRSTIDPAADQVFGDPDRLEQAIDNLVANALRHTPPGGTVEIGAKAAGDTIVLSVVDSGGGIPPEHVRHVFDRFYKIDASRAGGSGGSGLGLSITKAIVERHGGTIDASSVPGRTAFEIRLPWTKD
jgi:signal transduction histidine kinase